MTLPYSPSKAVYSGNGVTVDFPFAFKIWESAQLMVEVVDPQGVVTPATGWTATFTDHGGTVTYRKDGIPLPSGWGMAILRDMPFTQGVDLISGTRFDPQVIEIQMDQATAERQQLKEEVDRCIKVPPTSQDPPDLLADMIFEARDSAQSSASSAAQSATEAFQDAERAKAEADSLKNLTVDVEGVEYGTQTVGYYDPVTGILTLFVPEGPTGQQGPIGAEGKQGIAGEEGPQGQRGIQGTQGTPGENGAQGQKGEQGLRGPIGPQGERGLQGTAAPAGAQGEQGPMGDSPWSMAFGQFRLQGADLLVEYTGTTEAQDFFINPETGQLEVII